MSNLKKFNAALSRHTGTMSMEDIIVDPEGTIRIEMNNGVATGVKDTPEAAEAEAVEATEVADDAVEDAEETEAAMEGLKILAKELDAALSENGGLTVEESDILTKEYLDLLARAKLQSPLCPSMESYGINDFHREEATKLLRQNVVLSTESIFENIMKVLKSMWQKLQSAVRSIMNHISKLTANLKDKFKRVNKNTTPVEVKQAMAVIKTDNNILSFGKNKTGKIIKMSQLAQIVKDIGGCIDGKSTPPYVSIQAEARKLFQLEYDDVDAVVNTNKELITKLHDGFSNAGKDGLFVYVPEIQKKTYEIREGESVEYLAIKIVVKPPVEIVGLELDIMPSSGFLAVDDVVLEAVKKKITDSESKFEKEVNRHIDLFDAKFRQLTAERNKIDIDKNRGAWMAISRAQDEYAFWLCAFKETMRLQFEHFKILNMEVARVINVISNACAAILIIKSETAPEQQ